ncbi:cytochrome c family protein [Roseibium denhamense]|uniref:Cytochrome c n=1 Tax=Roseibium denhamense TaxID=76305 RepID=A0ABY1P1K4_9HYPH|nr:cytochrome c family protein [Roseibium denhamense]MTI07640.1 cytochrome c family protein [Roseibium denhamense]SMP24256.1 cytochrome c [Roseibium denhamense]
MQRFLIVAGVLLATGAYAHADGDPAAGEKVFRKCQACHMVGPDAKNRVGPVLNGIVGNNWGTVEGFKYSASLVEGAEAGRVWDAETLDAFLTKPRDVVPKTKMAFAGLRKEKDRTDMIAYLAQFAPDGSTQ